MDEWNIVLTGMPGVGKSTVGVLLAKATRREFLDTDVRIQAADGRTLQEIIDTEGLKEFCRIEEHAILSLNCRACVIATGGSVVYSPAAMEHLRKSGTIVHLDLELDQLEQRISNLPTRGVVIEPGRTFRNLYEQRQPLYRRWADVTIDCGRKNHEQVVAEILQVTGRSPARRSLGEGGS